MIPREPTRHQLSSRLAYSANTPSFLLKLQNQVAGRPTDDDEDEPQYLGGVDEFGRERRPPIPERPETDDKGSESEDDADEKPVVVVLKEGKHLTELQARNEKRKAEGLPPLDPESEDTTRYLPSDTSTASGSSKLPDPSGLSFSSKKARKFETSGRKRKATNGGNMSGEGKRNTKKSKIEKKGLLSFDRDDMG